MAASLFLTPFLFRVITLTSAVLLRNIQNLDFESPPTNIPANATSLFLLLPEANTIPGWSFSGTVWYVASGPNIPLPGNGHAIQLGQNGKINQTLKANGAYNEFVLTFTIAPAGANCATNSTAVNISAAGRSNVFFLQRGYGRVMWETYGYNLGIWGDTEEPINLEIRSLPIDPNQNFTCWPLVDTIMVKAFHEPYYYSDNMLGNGGFEIGPRFLLNSSEGILLVDDGPGDDRQSLLQDWQSPLQDWSISGNVKYIDSKHYAVPYGNAAIELISGTVSTTIGLQEGKNYNLDFVIGDANDSCLGDFVMYAQVGMEIWNFTMNNNGNGSNQKHSIKFKCNTNGRITLSFFSFKETQTSEHSFCGPVIDRVVLLLDQTNDAMPLSLSFKLHRVVISCLVVALTILWINV